MPETQAQQEQRPPVEVALPKVTVGPKGARSNLKDRAYGDVEDYAAFASYLARGRNPDMIAFLDAAAHRVAREPGLKHGDSPCPGVRVRVERES